MKAVRIHEDGGPEVLRYEDADDPVAGPGEVLIRLRAASLNHLDLWTRQGLPSAPKPRILGADGAGVVEAVGAEADGFAPGDKVVINPGLEEGAHILGEHSDGTHAELIAVPADYVHPLPGDLSFVEAAAFPLVFETAYRMLVTRARLEEDEWVLVWGAGGGVASAALVLAKALGGRVIATSSSDDKLERAREFGADAVVNHETGDVAAAVKEATEGRGANVVIEHVGEATWKTSLQSAGPEGRIVVCGATSGPNPPAQLHRIWWKQLSILGSTMGTRADFAGAYDLVARGTAKPIVDRVFPLSEAAAAHEHLESGKQFGKVVLEIGEG
ncbi:MAG TPA: zinc-binding dehydrogenase [Gaiellaceae bacterium]|nr:zinc-binding dehydrogenase [Gaiellaceae bacterium]